MNLGGLLREYEAKRAIVEALENGKQVKTGIIRETLEDIEWLKRKVANAPNDQETAEWLDRLLKDLAEYEAGLAEDEARLPGAYRDLWDIEARVVAFRDEHQPHYPHLYPSHQPQHFFHGPRLF